tara:strand:- start:276 stop:497 length:222 start_codon:yes stop_codon:yes gene_type:complete
MKTNNALVPTTLAAVLLGRSESTLKRYRDVCGGFLENGKHYFLGPNKNSVITWDVEAVKLAFHKRGLQARAGK